MSHQLNRVIESENDSYINLFERIDRRTLANNDILQYDSGIERWKNVSLSSAIESLVEHTGFFVYGDDDGLGVGVPTGSIDTVITQWGEFPPNGTFNEDDQFDLINGIWTCPKSGYYQVSAHVAARWIGDEDYPCHGSLELEFEDPDIPDDYYKVLSAQKTIQHNNITYLDLNLPKIYITQGQKARLIGRCRVSSAHETGTLYMNFSIVYEIGGPVSWFSIVYHGFQ